MKHQAPTLRRVRSGSSRRTVIAPTRASLASVSSRSLFSGTGASATSTSASILLMGVLPPASFFGFCQGGRARAGRWQRLSHRQRNESRVLGSEIVSASRYNERKPGGWLGGGRTYERVSGERRRPARSGSPGRGYRAARCPDAPRAGGGHAVAGFRARRGVDGGGLRAARLQAV